MNQSMFPTDIENLISQFRTSMHYGELLNTLEKFQQNLPTNNIHGRITPIDDFGWDICGTGAPDSELLVHNISHMASITFLYFTQMFDQYNEYGDPPLEWENVYYQTWSTGCRTTDISLGKRLLHEVVIPNMLAAVRSHEVFCEEGGLDRQALDTERGFYETMITDSLNMNRLMTRDLEEVMCQAMNTFYQELYKLCA